MTHAARREKLTQNLLLKTRELLNQRPLDRKVLNEIEAELANIASQTELWSVDDFAEPAAHEKQNRFQIAQEGPEGLSLYLNVMRPGKKIPLHDHTTWACVAAVVGTEINTLFDRLDDGAVKGKAELTMTKVVDLKPGNSISLMPDDIHSVEIGGTGIIRHLHLYGQPLETLTGRTMFDIETGTCKVMDIGVKTKS